MFTNRSNVRHRALNLLTHSGRSSAVVVAAAIALAACGSETTAGLSTAPTVTLAPEASPTTTEVVTPIDKRFDGSEPTAATTTPPTDPAGTTTTTATTTATNSPTEPSASWPETSTVEWFDHTWEFSALQESASDSDTTRLVWFDVRLRNQLADRSYRLPAEWLALRSTSDEVFKSAWAWSYQAERNDFSIGAEAESSERWYFEYEVPNQTPLGDLWIELGASPDRRAIIRPDGVEAEQDVADVTLATTSWDGEYSWNSVTLVLTGATASTSAGRYDNGDARPAPQFNNDRQADEGEVFVRLDFDLTEYSTSGVGGINVNDFRISADGTPQQCAVAAPGLVGGQTVPISVTCPVPVDASSLLFEIGTDACVGGCKEWAWTSSIDPGFLAEFS